MADVDGLRGCRVILTAMYFTAVLIPTLLLVLTGKMTGISVFHAAARVFAVTAFSILMLQPVLSARFHWVEKPFGLDRIFKFHRTSGVAAGMFALLHPIMLVLGSRSLALFTDFSAPWQINAGRAALLVLVLYGLAALYRRSLKIPFQIWLRMHNAAAPLIIALAFLHSWGIAIRYMPEPLRIAWFIYAAACLFSYLHLTLYQRLSARRNPLSVTEVNKVTGNTWEIVMARPDGKRPFDYLPGQFLFLTLLRGRGLPVEEHPFTISTSPADGEHIAVTVKESGDFTMTAGKTKPGDKAAVLGPYGRFSFTLHPAGKRTVFIAGGIGITPILSMLRYMARMGIRGEKVLFYANRTQSDIAFREELEGMAQPGNPMDLTLVHVLSSPLEGWPGERGRLDGNLLGKYLGSFDGTAYYICGPPPMMESVAGALLLGGADSGSIHMEKFAL